MVTNPNRMRERSELLVKFGALVAPLENVVAAEGDASDLARARAKFSADRENFDRAVKEFARGENDHFYRHEQAKINVHLNTLDIGLDTSDLDTVDVAVASCREKIIALIETVPADIPNEIFTAQTPFSTYCVLKDICATATQRMVIVDPYIDFTVFHRFLRDTTESLNIVLVSVMKRTVNSHEFLDISRMFAAERGPTRYRLITHPKDALHDRWLCCDDVIYSLGGSLKDAGVKSDFTISAVTTDSQNSSKLDTLVANGEVHFGGAIVAHP